MTLRVAIIKELPDEKGFTEAVPGYTDTQFLSRITANVNEKFLLKENYWKRRFTRKECLKLLKLGYEEAIKGLKEETVTLP